MDQLNVLNTRLFPLSTITKIRYESSEEKLSLHSTPFFDSSSSRGNPGVGKVFLYCANNVNPVLTAAASENFMKFAGAKVFRVFFVSVPF